MQEIEAKLPIFTTSYFPLFDSLSIIGRNMNGPIGKDENNKFGLHTIPKRNNEYLIDFSIQNSICLNTNFQKGEGKQRKYN